MPRALAKVFCLCLAVVLPALAVAGTHAFQAPTAPIADREDVLVEGFEGAWPPAGWAEITTHPNNWRRTNYTSNSGVYCATVSWSTGLQDEWLVTPALDFSSAVNPKIEFYEDSVDWSTGGHHYVMYSTTSQTDPAAFTIISDMTPGNHVIPGFGNDPTTINLLPAAGSPTVYIALRYTGNAGTSDTWYVDDVRVYKPGEHDVAAIATVPNGVQLAGDEMIIPQVLVENIGSTTESFDVQLEVSQSGTVVLTDFATVTDLGPGLQQLVDFPEIYINSGEYFDLIGTTLLVGDGNANNDVAIGQFDTYSEPHVPLGMLFTNSGCVPCVPANQALDAFMPGQGNSVALMRIHVWWPWSGDIMYQANIPQATALVSEFNVSGVPDMWIDAHIPFGWDGPAMVAGLTEAKTWKSPINIDLGFNPETDDLTVTVNTVNSLRPETDLELYCTITEDNIAHQGPNGEPIHMQAFRHMWAETTGGQPVSSSLGSHVLVENCPVEAGWNYDELRATVYVRDMATGKILQAGTDFLANIEGSTGVEDPASVAFGLEANFPNPFNPKTAISYSLESAGDVSLRIYDAEGRLVRTLLSGNASAGRHTIDWDGTNDAGASVASGVYLYRLDSARNSEMRKMMLLK